MKILVTGATGNVGSALLHKLEAPPYALFAGVRNIEKARHIFKDDYMLCQLDFEKGIYPAAEFDAVFLMRPPQLTSPDLFERFLNSLQPTTKVVFLSVFGAEKRAYLPHTKIEKVITRLGLKHVFIRPSYFMENLTTTLWEELEKNCRIYLPSANLKFNWIAVDDIAEVAAIALTRDLAVDHIEVCSPTTYSFGEVVAKINAICSTSLSYESPSLMAYVLYSLKQQKKLSQILVMLLLHYLPRFSRDDDSYSCDFSAMTGKDPLSLEQFIRDNCTLFEKIRG